MSKIKKILILMIIMLGTMFLFNNSVNASISRYGIKYINLEILKKNNDHLYCVNHGQYLNSYVFVEGKIYCKGYGTSYTRWGGQWDNEKVTSTCGTWIGSIVVIILIIT